MGVVNVAAAVIAEVVGLESRRHRPQSRVEDEVSLLLVDIEPAGPSRKRRGRFIDMDVIGVGPLEVVKG